MSNADSRLQQHRFATFDPSAMLTQDGALNSTLIGTASESFSATVVVLRCSSFARYSVWLSRRVVLDLGDDGACRAAS